MTDALTPSKSDVAHALMEARQVNRRSPAAAASSLAQTVAAGRSGHEGDSVSLSPRAQQALAQQAVKVTGPDGQELTPIPLDKLKIITPQGQRSEAEAAIKQVMADLGLEGDLEFSIEVKDDGSIAVQGAGEQGAALEAAINADPALQRLMRNTYMSAKFAYTLPAMKNLFSAGEDQGVDRQAVQAARAARERVEAASFTLTLTDGLLTTAFVDPAGGRFSTVAPEAGSSQST